MNIHYARHYREGVEEIFSLVVMVFGRARSLVARCLQTNSTLGEAGIRPFVTPLRRRRYPKKTAVALNADGKVEWLSWVEQGIENMAERGSSKSTQPGDKEQRKIEQIGTNQHAVGTNNGGSKNRANTNKTITEVCLLN